MCSPSIDPRMLMIKTVRVGDVVGFRTFSGVIRYGEVVELVARGEGGRATRKDEISVRLKPDGRVVMVQRWRISERYDGKKLNTNNEALSGRNSAK
jgi:hypothetical protein